MGDSLITNDAKLVKALGYAEHIKGLSIQKGNREAEINHLRGEMGLTVGTLGDKVRTSPTADTIPNAVIRLQELIADYVTDLAEYVDEIRTFIACLDQIDKTQARALHARYVKLHMWKQIADEMGYSEQHIYEIRASALVSLYDVMPEFWRSKVIPDAQD